MHEANSVRNCSINSRVEIVEKAVRLSPYHFDDPNPDLQIGIVNMHTRVVLYPFILVSCPYTAVSLYPDQ